jgi:hypothetical protein
LLVVAVVEPVDGGFCVPDVPVVLPTCTGASSSFVHPTVMPTNIIPIRAIEYLFIGVRF